MYDKITLIQGDITKLKVDAIVNAANTSLLGGGGVDRDIHEAAGPELLKECRTLNGCKTGEAKITKGYNLPAHYVIHTVGPVYDARQEYICEKLLYLCYINSLNLTRKYNIHSIAFPSISTGVYGYPPMKAAKVVKKALMRWLEQNEDYNIKIYLCCFKPSTYNFYSFIFKNDMIK